MLNHILPCHRLGSPLTTLVQLVCNVSCNVHVRVAFALTPGLITKAEVNNNNNDRLTAFDPGQPG